MTIIGFADFEAKLEPISTDNYKFQNDVSSDKSFTVKKGIHSIVSFSLIFVDKSRKIVFEKCYCGDNSDEMFLDTLDKIEEKLLLNICKNKTPISIESLSSDDLNRFNNASKCEICHVTFYYNDRLKCKNLDHDHYTNRFRYASCTMCNLLNRSQNHIPIYFHNFCSYDSKLLINVINRKSRIRVPPKFLFSNLQQIRFLTYTSY